MRDHLRTAVAILPQPYKRRLLWIAVTSAGLAIFDAALLLIVGPIVGSTLRGGATSLLGIGFSTKALIVAAASILILKNVLFILLARYKNLVLFELQAYFSRKSLEAILQTDSGRSHLLTSGKKSSYVITEPLQAVLNLYTPALSLITEISLICFVTLSLLAISPLQTIALFGTLTLLVGIYQRLTRTWLQASGARRKEADGVRHEILRAVIDSETDIRALKWEERVLGLYDRPNECSSDMTANKAFSNEIIKSVVELAVICGVGMIVVASATVAASELVPMLAVFGTAAYRLAPAFNRLMINSQSIRFGLSSLNVVVEMLSMTRVDRRAEDHARDASAGTIAPEIRVEVHKLVSPSGTILMENEEFRLARGEVVVVVGPSGIGKSTLVRALIDGAPGVAIFVGGERVPSGLADLRSLRIGMAGQRALVLPETLAFNVLQHVLPDDKHRRIPETAYERMILQSLADCHVGSVIGRAAIEQNLNCPISTSALSGGQGQRIGLMRALLLGTDLLILDEPTSALDSDSRDRFIGLLRELMPSRMILIVSHDPAFENLATQVFRIGVSRDDK